MYIGAVNTWGKLLRPKVCSLCSATLLP